MLILAQFYFSQRLKGGENVTDTALLQKYVDDSGLKQRYIAEKIGLTSYGYARKRDNLSSFRASEIDALCELLKINSLEERFAVFFAKEGDLKTTSEGETDDPRRISSD